MNWYQDSLIDEGVIISSRIRLARNLKKYPFPIKINNEQAKVMIDEAKGSIINDRTVLSNQFRFYQSESLSQIEKLSLLENHCISPEFINGNMNRGLLLKNDESISIMLNEEDHVRIQTISPGDNIDMAWDLADKTDNLIEEILEYAFDQDLGYLTSCPTNTGTGLRASYMVHIPMLEKSEQLTAIVQSIGKFGMTVRGIHGEGTQPLGSIYQISNQMTMGKSETEIIEVLKNVTDQVIERENIIRESTIAQQKEELQDQVYRAYGILAHCRKISCNEALSLLSQLRFGYITGLLELDKPKTNIYQMMMNIQPGHIQMKAGKNLSGAERDRLRADYIRGAL